MARKDLLDQGGPGARQADDEDRIRRLRAEALSLFEEFAGVDVLRPGGTGRIFPGAVRNQRQSQCIPLAIVLERFGILRRVLGRLAQGKLEVQAVFVGQVASFQLAAHFSHFPGVEAKGLEVGHAPVRFAEFRVERDTASIGLNCPVLVAGSLQGVAEAEPKLGIAWQPFEQLFVEGDRSFVLADAAQAGGLQDSTTGMVGFPCQQQVELCDGFRGPVVPLQNEGVVLPRLPETGSKFDASFEQVRRVVVATQLDGDLRQHADGGHVGRRLHQVLTQQGLRFGQPVFAQGDAS